MIQGAARELAVGDPSALATDVSPVIDREAFDGIQQHLQRLNSSSKVLLAQKGRAKAAIKPIANGISPAAYEVSSLAGVKDEIFGAVLQIVRWDSGELKTPAAVIAQINALGYGLTLGETHQPQSRRASLGRGSLSAQVLKPGPANLHVLLPGDVGTVKLRQPFTGFEGRLGVGNRVRPVLLLRLELGNLKQGIGQVALPPGAAGVACRQFLVNRQAIAVSPRGCRFTLSLSLLHLNLASKNSFNVKKSSRQCGQSGD